MDKNKVRVILKGKDQTKSVRGYRQIGDKCEVTFSSGKTYKFNSSNVQIVESILNKKLSRNCFDYLKEIADKTGLQVELENNEVLNVLANSYSKIGFVAPNSLLGGFLSGTWLDDPKVESLSTLNAIYPFGFNSSQKKAVDNALSSRLSIIEGPPGTGKTQTILNIIANAVLNKKTVAVVSSNNSATQNVFDKLAKNNLDFISASLGSQANKKEFVESQKPIPKMEKWKLSFKEERKLQLHLQESQKELEVKLKQKVELSRLRQELDEVRVELRHFEKYAKNNSKEDRAQNLENVKKSADALAIWVELENQTGQNWLVMFFKYIFEILKVGKSKKLFVHKKLKQFSREYLIKYFQHQFYNLRIAELDQSILEVTHALEGLDDKMSEYTNLSLKLFKGELASYYSSGERDEYQIDDLRSRSEEFLKDYPVVLSTTYSLRNSLSSHVMYDYLIVDESSQVDICTGALALSCAQRVVVVGDLMQLPHVVTSKCAQETDKIFFKYSLSEKYRYKSHSLLSSIVEVFPNAPKTLLKEHYRCHPKIIEFCNKKFYDNQLVVMTEAKVAQEPLIVYKTVAGNHERNRMNQRQIDVIKEEVIPEQSLNTMDGSLGVITPYRNQTNQLQKAFSSTQVQADTVDKFQGQEKKVVVLSTVDNDISEFTDNANRLNVAISRAIDQLILVVNDSDNLQDTNIGDLVNYVEYNNFETVESQVHSVFDYLYRCYAEQRRAYLKQSRRVSRFDSENLMYALITDVLKDGRFKQLRVATHVPLRMIIRQRDLLTTAEAQYASNVLSHVDFLIFDSLGKTPKLAIEVDGVAFHQEGTRQATRDEMKNNILTKYNLPFLRFKTDGSNERARLIKRLEEVVG